MSSAGPAVRIGRWAQCSSEPATASVESAAIESETAEKVYTNRSFVSLSNHFLFFSHTVCFCFSHALFDCVLAKFQWFGNGRWTWQRSLSSAGLVC